MLTLTLPEPEAAEKLSLLSLSEQNYLKGIIFQP
jgi:hypothetical protein